MTAHRAEDLLRLAESDPRSAIRRARQMIEEGAGSDSQAKVEALRAIGIAERTLGDIGNSLQALRKALQLAKNHGDEASIGEVELTLAASVAFSGDFDRAFRLLDQAGGRLDPLGCARVEVQRAGLIARTGEFETSLSLYQRAEPLLVEHSDLRWLALLSANRGLVRTYRGDFAEARRDLERASDLYDKLGRASSGAEMIHNIGFLNVQIGDIPAALTAFDQAAARFEELGIPLSELMLDRAEALLLVGMASEAQHVARETASQLTSSGLEIERGEALLMEARAGLAAGDNVAAERAASEADVLLADQGRSGWRLRARYMMLAARSFEGSERSIAELERLAEQLARSRQLFPSLHAQLLSGQIALRSGDLKAAKRTLSRAGGVPRGAPVDLRVQAWLAQALLHRETGNSRRAEQAVRTGVQLLEEYRSTLGATESRVNVARHATELFELGLQMSFASGRPSKLLAWVDRSRSGMMRLVPPRPPEDPELAQAIADLRSLQREVRAGEVAGEQVTEAQKRQTQLERKIRRLSLRQPGSTEPHHQGQKPPPLSSIQSRLEGRAMVVLAVIDGQLVGIRVRGGSIRMMPLGPAETVRWEADHLNRSLRSFAVQAARRPDRSPDAISQAAAGLDDLLFGQMRLRQEGLIVVPPAFLHSLPWTLLPSFGERPSVVSPSPYAWFRAFGRESGPGPTLLVAGPRLQHAEAEVDDIALIHPDAIVLKGADATVERVLQALDGARIAHMACHGQFRSDNAMFSSLELTDGHLNVYDIEQVRRGPETIVLSACDTGLSQAAAGDELMGLSIAFLRMGTRSLVVSAIPLPDAAPTRSLMKTLHQGLAAGLSGTEAMFAARASIGDTAEATAFAASNGLVCMGA